jgi:serine/threonine protein kinase
LIASLQGNHAALVVEKSPMLWRICSLLYLGLLLTCMCFCSTFCHFWCVPLALIGILCAQVSPELRDFISQLLDKDVMQRLDVTAAMQHPWVTLGGSAPLASCRQQDLEQQQQQQGEACGGGGSNNNSCLGLDVSQEDIDAAIRQIGCSMSELMDVVFEEVTLQAG